MARKKKLMEDDADDTAPESRERRTGSIRTGLRFAGLTLGLVAAVFGAAWTIWQSEHFLESDPRFRIAAEDESADAVVIRGAKNAQLPALQRVFEADRGRSLYEVNAEKRRMQLRAVEWVRDASVQRIWPNRLAVDIIEREPVAFIKVASGASGSFEDPVSYQPMLVDGDGMILNVRGSVPEGLPLLTGLNTREDIELRRARVRKMMLLLAAAKEYRSHIPEIDVARTDNLKATYEIEGRQITLLLGSERYKERVELFLRNWDKCRETVQPGDILDVTLDNRIVIKRAGSGIR